MNNNKIKIVDPKSKAVMDPLFCVPDEKLGDYMDANLDGMWASIPDSS